MYFMCLTTQHMHTCCSGKRKLARLNLQRRGVMPIEAAISRRRGTAFSSLVVPHVLSTHLVG